MSTNISNININMNNVKINVKENMIYESNFCKILVKRNTLKSYFWHLPVKLSSKNIHWMDIIDITLFRVKYLSIH